MNTPQVLQAYWSSFGIPAYDENTVPDTAVMPYITYESSDDYFGADRSLSASLWYRSPSWIEVATKEQEIADFIGRGGRGLAVDGGGIWLKRGTPWAQRMAENSDRMVRRIVLNYEVEFIK